MAEGEREPTRLKVSRRYAATPERVFDAWLDPALLAQWMFGARLGREEEVVHIRVDARVGGAFSFLVRRQGQAFDHVGTYRVIDRPRTLAFTWGIAGQSTDESVVTIEVIPAEGGSQITLTHAMDPKWAEFASRTEAGWTKMMAVLAEVL